MEDKLKKGFYCAIFALGVLTLISLVLAPFYSPPMEFVLIDMRPKPVIERSPTTLANVQSTGTTKVEEVKESFTPRFTIASLEERDIGRKKFISKEHYKYLDNVEPKIQSSKKELAQKSSYLCQAKI